SVERRRDLVAGRLVERLCKVRVFAPLRIEGSKKPKLVFLECPAQIEPGIKLRETIRSRASERKMFRCAHQYFGREVSKDIAEQIVSAAFGENVENAAGRQTVLS